MNRLSALGWEPPPTWQRVSVIEAHTGGEPFRVVVDGLPDIPGSTVIERRRHAREHLDGLRKAMTWEPRGHADMYCGWLGPPASDDGDLSVLFVHNEGFSTMCGHGIIALCKVVLDTGILPAAGSETTLRIDTPAGQVVATSMIADGVVQSTRFLNVPSFALSLDDRVRVEGLGEVSYDLGFGGAFYAIVDAGSVGVELDDAAGLIDAGRSIKQAIVDVREIAHPDHPDLGFLYGVIFTGPAVAEDAHSRNVCVFADGEVDRSPTGTGVSARLAILHARGEVGIGEELTIESIVGSLFTGRIAGTTSIGDHTAIVPEIEGSAHITGRAELWLDPSDALGRGFLIR
ncbi:MAG TPA: proline racemase family protein [Acidimicrobiia bacterium]|nr:proline racemase family protein [Acidimicrobiia bacterium]